MQIFSSIFNIEGRYNVQMETQKFSAIEEQLLLEFGEPLVDVGGSFSGSPTRPGAADPVSVTFTLPSVLRRIKSDFPAKQIFDLADDPNSDLYAKVWSDTIQSRLIAAKTTLVSKSSPFEGQSLVTV